MNTYEITFKDADGEIIITVIYADTLKEAKQICRDNYSVKKFF